MHIRLITNEEEFKALRKEWSSLVAKSPNDVPHLSHEWMTAWWNNFSAGNRLNILAVYDTDGTLAGVAPFMKGRAKYRGVWVDKLQMMANGHSPNTNIIAREGCLEQIVEVLFDYLNGIEDWDIMELFKLEQNDPAFKLLLEKLKKQKRLFGVKDNFETPYIKIQSSWDDFLSKRSQRFRKSIRNKLNRAKNLGGVSFEKIPIRDSGDSAFNDMLKVSESSWKRRFGTDMSSNPSIRGFYRELCDMMGKKGLITLWAIKKDSVMIAFEFHITYNGISYPIRADFDESYNSVSPGSLLEYNIIKSLFEDSTVKEYNTCGYTYFYLMNWTELTRKQSTIEIFNRHLKPAALYFLEYRIIPVLRHLKLTGPRKTDHHKVHHIQCDQPARS